MRDAPPLWLAALRTLIAGVLLLVISTVSRVQVRLGFADGQLSVVREIAHEARHEVERLPNLDSFDLQLTTH